MEPVPVEACDVLQEGLDALVAAVLVLGGARLRFRKEAARAPDGFDAGLQRAERELADAHHQFDFTLRAVLDELVNLSGAVEYREGEGLVYAER